MIAKTYQEKWQLENLMEVHKTATSRIYSAKFGEKDVILKLLSEVGRDDEQHGAAFLNLCQGQRVAKLYEFDEEAQLLEFLPGEDLYVFFCCQRGVEGKCGFLSDY